MAKLLRLGLVFVVALLLPLASAEAQKKKTPPGLEKKSGIPPGHARRGCLPPGLAKKLGPKPPCKIYVAVDPEHQDRAWFLIGSEWVLKANLEIVAQKEIKAALEFEIEAPPPPPPVPLPKVEAKLEIMFFSD